MKEILLLTFCILLFGIGTLFKRLGLAEIHPYYFLMTSALVYLTAVPLWFWLSSNDPLVGSLTTTGVWYAIIYSIFSLGAGLSLAFLLRDTNHPGTIILMVNLSAFVTLLLSYVFLHEPLSPLKVAGVALAFISLILLNI